MKTKLLNLFAIITIIMTIVSCDTEDEKALPYTTGTWSYAAPHFVFDYASDSLQITMGSPDKKMIWAVKDLQAMFLQVAHEKMSDYFKGIHFISDKMLSIDVEIPFAGEINIPACYLAKDDFLELELDATSLKELTGENMNIPKISFKCSYEPDHLMLYIDKVYLQVVASMMMDQILELMLPSIIPAYPMMPPPVKAMIINSFKQQINQIFENTQQLEIGIKFVRKD